MIDNPDETVTPRPWPENAVPEPVQLAGWLAVCTPDERLRFAESAIRHMLTANECDEQNHRSAVDRLRVLNQNVAGALSLLDEWDRMSKGPTPTTTRVREAMGLSAE